MKDKIKAAKALAKIAHKGQTYGGRDYFTAHVEAVAKRVAADKDATYGAIVAAYLHDTVEDTDLTIDDLDSFGFDTRAVDALTRRNGEKYFDFIKRVSFDPTAKLVKKHDIAANLAAKPCASLVDRYTKALAILA